MCIPLLVLLAVLLLTNSHTILLKRISFCITIAHCSWFCAEKLQFTLLASPCCTVVWFLISYQNQFYQNNAISLLMHLIITYILGFLSSHFLVKNNSKNSGNKNKFSRVWHSMGKTSVILKHPLDLNQRTTFAEIWYVRAICLLRICFKC